MLRFTKFAIFFIMVNFLLENMGFFTHWLNLFLGIILLVCFIISYLNFKVRIINIKLFVVGLIFFLFGFILLPQDIILRLIGLAFILFGFQLFLRGINQSDEEIPILLFATAAYLFFIIFYKYNPFIWCGLQSLSLSFTTLISSVMGRKILFGHTFLGLPASLLLVFIILSSYLFLQKKKISSLILSLVLILVSHLVYMVSFVFLEEVLPKKDLFLLGLPLLFPLLLLVPLYFNLRSVEFCSLSLNIKGKKKFIQPIILLLVAFSISFLTFTLPAKHSGKEKVVFYTKGFLNWGIPNFEDFGAYSSGMFGNLPLFVARLGFEPNWIEVISQEILKEAKILVMINIDGPLLEFEKEAIWDFVKKGGSLLLLGDHTFYNKKGRNYLNEILEPINIRYNFDSADYFVGGWLHSYEYLHHPITTGLGDIEDEPGIVVGASLKVAYPAYPIIMGKYGYSDAGRKDNPEYGYLGNLDYDLGEQLGDLILVACQNYGEGKVLVFGDTSSFVNSLLVFSHDFVNRVFTWLGTDKRDNFNYLYLFISLATLITALFLFLLFLRSQVVLIYFTAIILICVLVTHWNNEIRIPKGNIAYVDNSHLGYYTLDGWKSQGTMGLHLNLMRNGYLSFMLGDFSKQKILNSDILIFIAPTKPFTSKEIEIIKEYVRKGGIVILAVGYEEKGGSLKLMNSFGFRVLNIPLGYFQVEMEGLEQIGTFYKGWPIACDNDKAQVLCSGYNYPLIVSLPYGKGKFVVIGDSFFFSNQILEEEEQPHLESIYFFRWLLHTLSE